ncbi:MAG: alpha/beta fold hydrolase [Frankiales bacterium]|nr:alpha/beta fold hydrolase [Frankiales bacterium]
MLAPAVQTFTAPDGVPLAYRVVGSEADRPLVLFHGYVSTGTTNWIRYGHAELLAARGFMVVMPDLRGHGDSARPHDASAYPPDVLTSDALALVAHLGLTEYDVGGYSLGGRTVIRMMVRGATALRAVVCGVGLDDVVAAAERTEYYRNVLTRLGTFERGSGEWQVEAFLRTVNGDPEALLLLLDSWVDTPLPEVQAITVPTAVVIGSDDERGARELADTLPVSTYVEIPGTHMSAVTKPALGEAIAAALA